MIKYETVGSHSTNPFNRGNKMIKQATQLKPGDIVYINNKAVTINIISKQRGYVKIEHSNGINSYEPNTQFLVETDSFMEYK